MWLLFFHVAMVFVGFALTTGIGIGLTQIVHAGDVRATRVAARSALPLATAGGVVLIVGVLFGSATAAKVGFSLSESWLVLTYVFVGLIILDGFFIRLPWVSKLAKAAQASPDDQPSEELRELSESRLAAVTGPLSGLLWLGTLIMMTVKPHL